MNSIIFWLYILPIIMNLAILIWWRYNCECDYSYKFPTRGHIVILFMTSLIPGIGLTQTFVFIIAYIWRRSDGVIRLKSNKFNKFWFDID